MSDTPASTPSPITFEEAKQIIELVCPPYSILLGALGIVSAIGLSSIGAGYATAKTGVAVLSVCTLRPDILMRAFVPVAMAGIVGLYGIIVAIFLMTHMDRGTYSLFMGSTHLGAGLVCGLSSLAAGFAIAVVGEAGVRGFAQQPRLFMGMILVLIFAEVLGIYGVIGAVYLNSKSSMATCKLPDFK